MQNTTQTARADVSSIQEGPVLDLTVAMVLHGMDLAYADDAQGNRFYLDLDSEGVDLSALRGGSKIKAHGVAGAWIGRCELDAIA